MTNPFIEIMRGYVAAQLKFLQEQESRRAIPAHREKAVSSDEYSTEENLKRDR